MPDPARETQDPTNRVPLVLAMADYAATAAIGGESALETARHCLIDALGRGFEALRDPERAARIGPIVPGALMPGGARVPGTSLELEPSQAAFCIGLLLCRPADADRRLASSPPRAADSLGAILAVADYQARRATMEGKRPPNVRDVLAAIVKALEIQGVLATLDDASPATGNGPVRLVRVTASALVAALLGATPGQIARAVGYASLDGDAYAHPDEQDAIARRDWAMADTIGRAVRHACQATAAGSPAFLTAADLELVELGSRLLGVRPSTPRKRFGTELIDRLGRLRKPADAAQLMTRFNAAVDRHFPTRQAQRINGLFAAPARLDDLPVNELIAALVTNGAHQR